MSFFADSLEKNARFFCYWRENNMVEENNLQSNLAFRPLTPTGKGLGDVTAQPVVAAVAGQGWNLLREDISLPVAVLSERRVQHNLQWMKSFIDSYGLKLAPHGKTTMSPALFHRQLAQGAWGITLATAPQVQAAYHFGVRRVILANQLVGRANMAIIPMASRPAAPAIRRSLQS